MRQLFTRLTGSPSAPLALLFSITTIALVLALELPASQDGPRDGTVRVSRFSPTGEIDQKSNITLQFSADLVTEDRLDQPPKAPVVKITPAFSGVARWIETNTLRIFPNEPLAPATKYRAEIIADGTFIEDRRIEDDRVFEFSTPLLQVRNVSHSTQPSDRPQYIQVSVGIQFNYPVFVSQLRDNLAITGSESATADTIDFEITGAWARSGEGSPEQILNDPDGAADQVMLLTEPILLTDEAQFYTLKIGEGTDCRNCGSPLEDDFVSRLRVEPRQRLIVHNVRSRSAVARSSIYIRFSTQIDTDAATDYITVDPPVDFGLESQYNTVSLVGDFAPGKTYQVSIEAGLPALVGTTLESSFSTRVKISDVPPTVVFRTEGIYLPRDGSRLLEMETINVDTVFIEVEHIFANNLVYALAGGHTRTSRWSSPSIDAVGRQFYTVKYGVPSPVNEKVTTTIDIGSIIGDTARGIFRVSARDMGRRWVFDSRLAMMTDIGLLARKSEDHLVVWTYSLESAEPLRHAEIRVYSKNSQELLSGRTDSRGVAVFDEISEEIGDFEPYVITAKWHDDLSYLQFDNTRLELSDFDVKGRPYQLSGYEAYVYPDRGIFRPGDTAHITTIVRDSETEVPDDFPYFLTVTDPTGRTYRKVRQSTAGDAFTSTDLPIPEFSRTGKYTIRAHIGEDYEIGRAQFQVESFIPDRIKVDVSTPKKEYARGETIPISVTGAFLFGPPTAGHQVSGQISIEPHTFGAKGFPKYTFTDDEREFTAKQMKLGEANLDEAGRHRYMFDVPTDWEAPSALKGLIGATVTEQGGRAVAGYREILIHPYRRYVGLRPGFEGYVRPGEPFSADIVAVNRDGEPVRGDSALVSLYRVVYNSILKRDGRGQYRYVSEKSQTLVESRKVAIGDGAASVEFTTGSYGRYRLEARDLRSGHRAAISFYASGWGYAPWSMEEPERIEIDLDRERYPRGERAKVQIRSPFGGTLLLTVEKDRVLEYLTVDMEENTAEVTLDIKDEYFPNVYVTATVIKRADEIDRTSPARAFGITPLFVTRDRKDLKVRLEAPDVIKPGRKLRVDVTSNADDGARLTVAAVDAGILSLTGFMTPDPLEFFYGQRAPLLMPYDIYSLVYPEIEPASSHLSHPGGRKLDMFEAGRRRHLSPVTGRRVKPVALWSGIVMTNSEGRASVEFDVPEFSGKLVLMAVAAEGNRFGSATGEVTVRDKIMIQESFPRFVSPNDEVRGLVTVFNHTGELTEITVQVDINGPMTVSNNPVQRLELAEGAEATAVFRLKAGIDPGLIEVKLRATAGIEQAETAFELPNRPRQPLVTRYGSGMVTDTTAVRIELPDGFIGSTSKLVLTTSSLSAVRLQRSISYLLGYPYGCVEQTTSQVFPLLYFTELARFAKPHLMGGNAPEYYVQEGILKLSTMMLPDGTFSYWPGSNNSHPWSSTYAGHFLMEARAAGFTVDEEMYQTVLARLKATAAGKGVSEKEAATRMYAGYALASINELDRKTMNDLQDLPRGDLPVYARFLLAGALALSGDRDEAFGIIDPIDIQPLNFEPETGGTFSSGVRTTAIMLEILSRIDRDNPSAHVLARDLIEHAAGGRWYTTQANAFSLMALGRYLEDRPEANYTGTIEIETDSTYEFEEADFRIEREQLQAREVTIAIDGVGPCYYYWQLSGVPTDNAPPEFSRGMNISREYLDAEGEPADLDSVRLGDQVIAKVTIEAESRDLDHVVINDLLPAGLAVENPRLKTTPRLSWIPKNETKLNHQDIRDDRVLVFTDLRAGQSQTFYYSLRAISAGTFGVPAIAAECMYNPLIGAAASSGQLRVREK